MKRICIQAGHVNVKYNSIISLRGSTGAPNEASFNQDIRDRVSGELRSRGFEVQGADANANNDKNITGKDWDLFLAIHYDADVYGKGGGFVAFPEPSTDQATTESQRITREMEGEYFRITGIANHPERRNRNTAYYYTWKYLSAKTPCVLVECGVGMHVPDDWQVLHFNRPLVVEGIVRGVCKAFGVPYETTGQGETAAETPPAQNPPEAVSGLDELRLELGNLREGFALYQRELETAKAQIGQIAKTIESFEEVTVLRRKQ